MLLLGINLSAKLIACLVVFAAPGIALALWFIPDALMAYHIFAPRSQGLLRIHRSFSTARREVWLTLDDGPDPEDTPRILEILARHGARATFFAIGRHATAHPELLRSIAAAGHEIGHHTHTHPLGSFWCASPARLRRELDEGSAALYAAAGIKPTRFRPPAGHKNIWLRAALRERGLSCIGWSAGGLERWHNRPERAAARAVRRVFPGAILLLHEGPRVPPAIRVRTLDLTLQKLTAEGYRCVIPTPDQLGECDTKAISGRASAAASNTRCCPGDSPAGL